MSLPDAPPPRPGDPTPEEREARIAELRARRRARMHVLAVRSALGTGLLATLLVTLGWWLLTTVGGRDVLLSQIVARLPDTATLSWQRAEGPASGPLTLFDVRFTYAPVCAAGDAACTPSGPTVFTARRVTLDPALTPLLGRRLRLDALQVQEATLDLPRSDTPLELPRWPEVLPRIEPPLALRAEDIRIDDLAVTRDGDALIDIHRMRGGLDASQGALHVEHVAVDSDRGRFALHGDYVPRENYRTDLTATALVPAANARTPLRLGLVARGDLARMDVGLAGNAPGPVRAGLTLREGPEPDRPRWRLRARADGIDTASLSGAGAPSPHLLTLSAAMDGVGGDARLQGTLRQGEILLAVQPSRLYLEEQVLRFSPLRVDVLDGHVAVRGSGDFRDARNARIDYAVSARGLRWGGGDAPAITADADLGIAGTQATWAVAGGAALARAGERARVTVDGRGSGARLTLRTLHAVMPTGTLDVTGRVAWRPRWFWDLQARMAGVDPGYFVPGWDGAVRGGIASRGRVLDPGGVQAQVALRELGGTLRGRALSGQADASVQGQRVQGTARLGIGRGRIEVRGDVTTGPLLRWDAAATVQDFDPGFFAAGWDGAVDARVASRGQARANGGIDAHVELPRIGGQLRGRALAGHGALDVQGDAWRGAVDLGVGGSRIDVRGSIARTLDVDARFAPLQLADLLPDGAGNLRGTLRLTGPRTTPDVAVDLQGGGLRLAGYAADTLHARGRLPWRAGAAPGTLDLRASGLQLGLPVESIDAQARGAVEALQLQARARSASGALSLSGALRHGASRWLGTLAALRLDPARGPAWQLQDTVGVSFGDGRIDVQRACLASAGGGTLCASADWPRRGVDVSGQGLPLSLVTAYLPERPGTRPWRVDGQVALDATLRPAGNAWRGQATVRSDAGAVRLEGRELLAFDGLRLAAQFDPQRVSATLASGLDDGGRIDAELATGWDGYAPLSGRVAVELVDLTWMELLSPDIVEPRGRLAGRLALGGTRAQPRLDGQMRLTGFTTEIPALGLALRDGQAQLDAQPDGSARLAARVRSGDGVLTVDGRLGGPAGLLPVTLHVAGTDVLAADIRALRAVVDPDVQVRIAAGEPTRVTGTVTVSPARINLERLDRGVSASSDVVVLDPATPDAGDVATPLALDLTLVAGRDVQLNGFGLTGAVDGRLHVVQPPGGTPRARGVLEVSGRYVAYGQRLDITRGLLTWSGGAIGDPMLDIRAEREVGDLTAGIDVRGRASAPQASVWSSEGGSQSEALSLLALGRPLSSVTGEEGERLNAANAALSAGGSLLASQLGARLGLDEAGIGDSRALGGSVLGIGKYLSPRLYVSYGVSLLGTGQVVTLRYLMRKGFDIEIETSTVETRGSVNYRKEK